jgi:hypothetical protein
MMLLVRDRHGRAMILGMAAAHDPVLRALSRAWQRIRYEDSRVPGVVYLQPGRPSGCSAPEWSTTPVLVMNLLRGEEKLTGTEILEWLLHHAAHGSAGTTTGSEGRFHPEAFKDTAERLGLAVERGPAGTGWSKTQLAAGTRTGYRPEITVLDRAMTQWEPVVVRKRDRGPQPYACSCSPPRRLRMNPGVAEKGPVVCGVCGRAFHLDRPSCLSHLRQLLPPILE